MTKERMGKGAARWTGTSSLTSPEGGRQPLLDALKECWDLVPSMRFTQLLINAKVFPHHLNDNWEVWDEETTKKLKKFTKELKKVRRK